MKQEWIARAKRFATYALVGCFDTSMDWVAFTTAHELLHFTPVICQAIGYFVGTVCSYFLNGRITFRDGHIARWRQCLRFVMWNVVSLGVSEVMIGLLTHFGLNPYIAKVGVTLEVALKPRLADGTVEERDIIFTVAYGGQFTAYWRRY